MPVASFFVVIIVVFFLSKFKFNLKQNLYTAGGLLPHTVLVGSFFIPDNQTAIKSPLEPHFVPHTLFSHYNHYIYTHKGYILMKSNHLTHFILKKLIFLLCHSCNCIHCECRGETSLVIVFTYQRAEKKNIYLYVSSYLQYAISTPPPKCVKERWNSNTILCSFTFREIMLTHLTIKPIPYGQRISKSYVCKTINNFVLQALVFMFYSSY